WSEPPRWPWLVCERAGARRLGPLIALQPPARALALAILGQPDLVEEEAHHTDQPDAHQHGSRGPAGGPGDDHPAGRADQRHHDGGAIAHGPGPTAHALTRTRTPAGAGGPAARGPAAVRKDGQPGRDARGWVGPD